MVSRVLELRRFPLKGAASVPERQLSVSPALGIANDRRFALRRTPGDMTRRADTFNKFDYVICANTAAMANERPDFVGTGHDYRLESDYLAGLRGRLQNGSDLQLQIRAAHIISPTPVARRYRSSTSPHCGRLKSSLASWSTLIGSA